jgi:hypothetical protein
MFKNISSRNLLIVFIILLAIAALFIYLDSSQEVRTFKRDIVDIDTSAVTAISIYPKVTNHKEVRLFKDGNYWLVRLENNKSAPAEESKIKNLINQLSEIKANRVAAQDKSKWSEYKVDTTGTRVKVFEGSDNTLDITLGKFTYKQPRSMASYVRVKGDENIYEVNGFLEFAFNQKPDYFRNNTLVKDDYTKWENLTYTYPADSSFQMVKDTSGYWIINNVKTDSTKTTNFLRTLSRLTGTEFIDNPDKSLLGKAKYTLTVESTMGGQDVITISAFGNQPIIHSSQNPDSYFNGSKNSLWKKIFAGKNYFRGK